MYKIEIGKNYYMDLHELHSWDIVSYHTFMYFDPEFYDYNVVQVNDIDSLYYGNKNFVEVKYIGNGVFFEVSTKTRILVLDLPEDLTLEDYDNNLVKESYLNLDDYIKVSKEIYGKTADVQKFFDDNKKIRSTIALASMVYDAKHAKIYPLNEENNRKYQVLPNNVRKEIVESMVKTAEFKKYKTVLELNFAYNQYSKLNDTISLTLKSKEPN